MKEGVFSFIWAALCAWIIVWLLLVINAKTGFANEWIFPNVIQWVQNWGVSFRKVLFVALFIILWATGYHKLIGNCILMAIGYICLIAITILALLCAYWLLSTLAGCL